MEYNLVGRVRVKVELITISVASAEFVAGGVLLKYDDLATTEFSEVAVDVSEELPAPETEEIVEIGEEVEGEGGKNTSDIL